MRTMPSRTVWKHGSGPQIRDAVASALLSLLLPGGRQPVYVASPYMSDFELFDNSTRALAGVVPRLADHGVIRFSDYLRSLAERVEVRVMTSPKSQAFVDLLRGAGAAHTRLHVRVGEEASHEKAIVADGLCIAGSMNFTHRGLRVNGERIDLYTGDDETARRYIAEAYFELAARWQRLPEETYT
jgi:phosphatidylserine/phosphatidylglycerophosphate/cardiolipin synthase-like enzyme